MIVFQVALLHLGAALSPGPDIFLTMRNAVAHGRAAGCATVAGIVTGVAIQIALCQLGLVWMLSAQPMIFNALAATGGCYLCYIGLGGLREQPETSAPRGDESGSEQPDALPEGAAARFFREGLLTNLLNPKALLYFFGVFSFVLTADVDRAARITAGLGMIVVQAAAFLAVAHLVTVPRTRRALARFQFAISRVFSLVLIFFGLRILVSVFAGV